MALFDLRVLNHLDSVSLFRESLWLFSANEGAEVELVTRGEIRNTPAKGAERIGGGGTEG